MLVWKYSADDANDGQEIFIARCKLNKNIFFFTLQQTKEVTNNYIRFIVTVAQAIYYSSAYLIHSNNE